MEFEWRFNQGSYDTLGRIGIDWQDVVHVLRGGRRFVKPDGSVLRVAGKDRSGAYLGVLLIEDATWFDDGDDLWLVVTAWVLPEAESAFVASYLERGQ